MHTCGVPGERLSPRSLPTPRCPSGHLAFLLCIFLINSLSQRQKLWWEAAYFVHFLRGLMWAQHSMLRSPSANIYPDLASSRATTDPHGAVRRDSRSSRNCSWQHKGHWHARDLLPFTSLPSRLRPASKPLWSVGRYSRNPKRSWWATLSFLSCVGI